MKTLKTLGTQPSTLISLRGFADCLHLHYTLVVLSIQTNGHCFCFLESTDQPKHYKRIKHKKRAHRFLLNEKDRAPTAHIMSAIPITQLKCTRYELKGEKYVTNNRSVGFTLLPSSTAKPLPVRAGSIQTRRLCGGFFFS